MQHRQNLYFAGGTAFFAVSAGCLYDQFFPHFVQQRYHGWVPDCPGLQLTALAALLLGYVAATKHIDRVRPKVRNDHV